MSLKKRLWFILLKRKSALAVILSANLFPTSIVTDKKIFTDFGDVKSMKLTQEKVYYAQELEEQPIYEGGNEKFYDFVETNMKIPDINKDIIIKMIISVTIEKDGSLSDILIHKEDEYGIAEDVINVLKKSPANWHPGKINNKPVRSHFMFPIVITIGNPKKT